MKRLLPVALIALTAAGTAAPAFAADKETRQMMADIRMLEEQAQQNQTQIAALIEEVKAMQKALNARIDDQAEVIRKGFADERTVTTAQSSDLRTIIERLNDNTTSIGKNSAEISALRQLLTSRTTMVAPDAGAAPDTTNASAAPAGATVPSAAGLSPSAVYDQAFSEYAQGHWDLAVSGFTAFINTFPAAPQAADAQAYICTSYYNAMQYREAVDACDAVIRTYPKADKVPYAYYRKGLAYSALHQNDDAKAAFEYILKNFPTSDTAPLADQGLQHLSPPPPAQKRQ